MLIVCVIYLGLQCFCNTDQVEIPKVKLNNVLPYNVCAKRNSIISVRQREFKQLSTWSQEKIFFLSWQ